MTLFIPPILQIFLFANAATLEVKNISIGIVNQDSSGKHSYELIQRIQSSPVFSNITFLPSIQESQNYIDTKQGSAVVYIGDQFSKNIKLEKPASIELILDGRKSNVTQVISSYISTIVTTYNNDIFLIKNDPKSSIHIESQSWYNPNLLYTWYTVPCLCGILTMVQALVITAMSIVRERELGTFDQLLVSPIRPIEILIGKSIPATIIAALSGTLILFVGIFFFQIPFTGSLLAFYISMLIFITSIVGVGLFISSICRTQQQALLGNFIFMSPSISLSGFATPIENMPIWLQKITYILPLRYFLIIIKGSFLKGMSYSMALSHCWPMALIALFTLSGAVLFFRKKVG